VEGFAGTKRFIPYEMKKESSAKDYSFPIDMYSLAIVVHRMCNLHTGKEMQEDVTQENFTIPPHFSENLVAMLKSWLAPKAVDRPILAEVALDPLFREFITLEPYNELKMIRNIIDEEEI